jgi:TRAP transporter 4TM/12TM fusion protein
MRAEDSADPAQRRGGPTTGADPSSGADPAAPGTEPAAAGEPVGPAAATVTSSSTALAGGRSADELVARNLIDQYDEERPSRVLSAGLDRVLVAACFLVSVFVLWQVFAPLQRGNQYYLILFLAAVLPLIFVCYRARARPSGEPRKQQEHDDPGIGDWLLAALALLVCLYPVLPITLGDSGGGFDAFLDRQGSLTVIDIAMGTGLTLLVLEACRRTTGLVLPLICVAFFLYAYYGGFLPISWPIGHAGFDFSQIINGFYNDQSGFYGIPLDVCATYIVLFTIYGAVLDATGAGRFFIDLSFAAFRNSRSAPGRTVTLSGFLLGSVSGSGTATAVSLGSVCWPILRRAGYPKEQAGGMLAAAGIGAILSPPTLGAAAFIIAEYVGVPYLQVLLWATIPTLLYYLGIILAVEIDARRFGARAVHVPTRSVGKLLLRFGYHFVSLFVIIFFLALDVPPFRAVVYATIVAALFGLIERAISRRDPLSDDDAADSRTSALRAYGGVLYRALAVGIRSVLGVASVCAAAGIITSVIVKTGLGQTLADLLIRAAQALASNPTAVLILTAVFSAIAIVVLGLAVPVTASFIISWVIIGPALQTLGATPAETAMFIFYYAVLSEVSPPTALAAVAAAAITGGDTIRTMWQAWKYTLPAFLAPLAFVITDNGSHLLMQGDVGSILWTTAVSMVAVAALAAVTGGWILGPASWPQRLLCVPAAVLLLYLQPVSIAIGLGFLAIAVIANLVTRNRSAHAQATQDEGVPS